MHLNHKKLISDHNGFVISVNQSLFLLLFNMYFLSLFLIEYTSQEVLIRPFNRYLLAYLYVRFFSIFLALRLLSDFVWMAFLAFDVK